ncbi:hypothetical protein C4D60_Mb11t07960 [Musa balbisiana]|uniref:Isocitrate lyase n=1 Tax=Musa balbisiana TaxID=52838 RepID=A0A4S8J2I9_MUSBA|nr:hypothetical protein C4D60_Mb11t07960 [Musa balbisiana]
MGLSSIVLLQAPPIPSLSSSTHFCCHSSSLPPPCAISKLQRRPQLFPSASPPSRGWNLSRKRCALAARAAAGGSAAQALRRILESPGIHQGPACFDALSGRLVERAGFPLCFMSGFSVSAARLGLPDVGLISYGEMADQGRQITQAVSPKACGHTRGRKVVSREEAVMHIKAAIDARRESGSDIVIVARTDSRQAVSLEESLKRSRAFADAGADVLFIDALASREEMKAFCEISPLLPKMANMLEGGGKTPILNPVELEEIGFKIVSYPLSLIGVSIRAMEDALTAIKSGRVPPPGSLPSFDEIKDTLGFNDYYEEEKRYSISPSQPSYQRGTVYSPGMSSAYNTKLTTGERPKQSQRADDPSDPVVEVVTPYVYDNFNSGDRSRQSGMWSRSLRLKITGRNGLEKLDVRIPAGFLEGMAGVIPGLGGVNIMQMLEDASIEGGPESGKILLDFNDAMGDRIQVFVE